MKKLTDFPEVNALQDQHDEIWTGVKELRVERESIAERVRKANLEQAIARAQDVCKRTPAKKKGPEQSRP